MKFCFFPDSAVLFCFITTCTFTVINAIDENVILETFKTKGSTIIVQTENTTDVYCKSIIRCAGICLSDPQCCVASYSKGTSTYRIDTFEQCCVETETLYECRLIQRDSYHNPDVENLQEVAEGKTAIQSSQYPNFKPGNANDGHLTTFSHTTNEQSPYWEVDLGRDYKIRRIQIFVRTDCCGPLHNLMTLCGFYAGPAQTGYHLVFECSPIINGRYVRIQKNDTLNLALAEVQVMAIVDRTVC